MYVNTLIDHDGSEDFVVPVFSNERNVWVEKGDPRRDCYKFVVEKMSVI